MNKVLITICIFTAVTIAIVQASPSVFKLPNVEDIEQKLKQEWNEVMDDQGHNHNHSGQRNRNNNFFNNNQRQHGSRSGSSSSFGDHARNQASDIFGRNNNRNDSNSNNKQKSRNHISKESSEDFSGEDQPNSVVNLKKDGNKFADQTLQKLKAKLVENGLNDISLPNDSRQFRKKFYGITYHGEALLAHGYLKGFENVKRVGEASMHGHTNGSSTLMFETEFSKMEVGYSLEISFMGQKIPSQKVKGYLDSVTAQIEILVDKNGKVVLTDFDVSDSGHFKIETTGLGSFNFLLDKIVDTIGNLTKRFILESMEGKIRLILNAVLNDSVYPSNALFASVQNELYSKFNSAVSNIRG